MAENSSIEDYSPYITEELINRGHARRMGHLEDYFAILQRQSLYNNFNLYCELNEEIDRIQLSKCLREIFLQNPILMHYIVPRFYPKHEEFYKSDEYLDKACPDHDFIRILEEINIDDILLNTQEEYNSIVDKIVDLYKKNDYEFTTRITEWISTIKIDICDPKKPSWRLLCLPSKDSDDTKWKKFIYVSNHCESDGMSSVNLFDDLVSKLNTVSGDNGIVVDGSTNNINIVNYSRDFGKIAKFPLPITERVNYSPPLSAIPRFIIANFTLTKLIYMSNNGMTPAEFTSSEPLTFDKLLNFSTEEISKIKRTIKTNLYDSVTLTPFIQACYFVAMYKFGKILNLDNWWQWGVDCALATNARKALPDDPEMGAAYRYGPNVGGTHYFNPISHFKINDFEYDKFYKLVDYYHKNYQNSYANGDEFIGFGILFSDMIMKNVNVDKIIRDDYTKHKRGGLLFSNVGYYKEDTSKTYFIKDIIFSQAPGCMKFSFGMNVISTTTGGMNIVLNGVRESIGDRKTFDEFCKVFKKTIENFAKL